MRNLFPASISREAVKNLSPWFAPVTLAITSHTLLCQWTPRQQFWDTLHRAAQWGEGWGTREGLGREQGGKDGSRVRPGRNVWLSLQRGKGHSWVYSKLAFLGDGWRSKILFCFLIYFMIIKNSFFFFWLSVIKDLFTLWFTISLVFALSPVAEPFFSPFPEGCCILAFENSSIFSYWFLPLIPPILLQSLDSPLTSLSLVFRVLAPHSPSTPIPGVFLSCAETRQVISLPLPLCLILLSVLCSAAWKAQCPCSLCNSSL